MSHCITHMYVSVCVYVCICVCVCVCEHLCYISTKYNTTNCVGIIYIRDYFINRRDLENFSADRGVLPDVCGVLLA